MPLPDATARWALPLAILALTACTNAPTPIPADAPPPPAFRASGERLPAFSGADPHARGWVKVKGLIWVDAANADILREGLLFDGTRYIPIDAPLAPGTPANRGYLMRTDHVSIRTNVPWRTALEVARVAEDHAVRFFAEYGDRFDVRFPADPLPIVVTASRAELVGLLSSRAPSHVSWAAFYDTLEGAVYVSTEPAPAGQLPFAADLRHEMTHQILDLARPPARRGRPFGPGWFWLWEGIAVHSETQGAGPTTDVRLARFRKRLAWNQVTPLADLIRLGPLGFEGRHYDQVGVLMDYLLDSGEPSLRETTLDLVRDLLRRPEPPSDLESRWGRSVRSVEQTWLATLGR